jgi:hypothetical protein
MSTGTGTPISQSSSQPALPRCFSSCDFTFSPAEQPTWVVEQQSNRCAQARLKKTLYFCGGAEPRAVSIIGARLPQPEAVSSGAP